MPKVLTEVVNNVDRNRRVAITDIGNTMNVTEISLCNCYSDKSALGTDIIPSDISTPDSPRTK